ncbi:MAG: hypothetical protein QOG43_1407 [Actinomycetota bacterium]|jgi:hypothetical protein|nr:hypothetical protein [Actinomycetota bacterium]
MGALLDDLYDHEGFAARRLADGTLTATWTKETAKFDAYVAACDCGCGGTRIVLRTTPAMRLPSTTGSAPTPGRCSLARFPLG